MLCASAGHRSEFSGTDYIRKLWEPLVTSLAVSRISIFRVTSVRDSPPPPGFLLPLPLFAKRKPRPHRRRKAAARKPPPPSSSAPPSPFLTPSCSLHIIIFPHAASLPVRIFLWPSAALRNVSTPCPILGQWRCSRRARGQAEEASAPRVHRLVSSAPCSSAGLP